MATFDVAKLLNKITQDIPGINTVLKALANWDVSALSDVPDGAMKATTDANNRLIIKKKVSGAYAPIAKLLHDVDTVDGYHASTSATANAIPVRNASGALPGNILGNAVTADTATALAAGSVVPVNQGGTGATTASQARANLGVADGADFTTHVATQASPSVEGHVKLDALAADGSNTAAPGGFGLGMPEATQIPANTDLDTVVLPGFYSCKQSATATTLTNCPVVVAFSMLVEFGAYGPTQTITTYNSGERFQRTKIDSASFGLWRSLPNGITNSTATTSSTTAASATAVKTAFDRAKQVATASISGGIKVGGAISSVSSDGTVTLSSATTTSRGTARVATLADMAPGAAVENGPAVLAAGSEALNALVPTFLIGSIISTYAADGYVPNGCVPPDGAEYTQSQFPSFYTDYLVAGRIVTCTYAEFAAQVALTGNCAKFALDTAAQKFKVPLLKNGDSITHAASAAELGKSVKAGLPNVTGYIEVSGCSIQPYSAGGAFSTALSANNGESYQANGKAIVYNMSLSAGNQIYGNSNTVTDEQVRLRHFVVLASAQNNASMFDWSNYMAALAGKLNADMSNRPVSLPYVTESYTNGANWYRIWSDGLIEQGGNVSSGAQTGSISLLKSYSNLKYGFYIGLLGGNGGYSSSGSMTGAGSVKTISSITWNYTGGGSPSIWYGNFDWWARGY